MGFSYKHLIHYDKIHKMFSSYLGTDKEQMRNEVNLTIILISALYSATQVAFQLKLQKKHVYFYYALIMILKCHTCSWCILHKTF